ncbi:hypothetical protein GCM10027294_48310 [Marinactinospora endophytica]
MRAAGDSRDSGARTVISRHFRAQPLRPAHLDDLEIELLSPYHRALLVCEATTRLIEAHVLEGVRASPTAQYSTPLSMGGDCAQLRVPPGSTVVTRSVDLVGASSGRRYAMARSLLVPGRIPAPLARGIAEEAAGIGSALHACGVESRRELLWYGGEADGTPTRTYRIVIEGEPAILITEWFPAVPG